MEHFLLTFGLVLITFTNTELSRDGQFFITTPQIFYAEQENTIIVRASEEFKILDFTSSVSSTHPPFSFPTQRYEMTKMADGYNGVNINYQPPFAPSINDNLMFNYVFTLFSCLDQGCVERLNDTNVSVLIPVMRRAPIVLGEVDKPVYRPGETVRFRFLALSPQFTVPLGVKYKAPTEKLIIKGNGEKELVSMSPDDLANFDKIIYDRVLVVDAQQKRVKQWINVNAIAALNMSLQLLKDASEGQWTVEAHVAEKEEKINFEVRHYVLPRFVVKLNHPKEFSQESKYVQFSVCANYSDGPPLLGSVKSQFCFCPHLDNFQGEGMVDDKTKQNIVESGTCPNAPYSTESHPCIGAFSILNMDGCSQFNLSTKALQLDHRPYMWWSASSIMCVDVEEDDTQSNVTRCEFAPRKMERQSASLSLQMPSVYKPGLPVRGTVKLKNQQAKAGDSVGIEVTEQIYRCYRPWRMGLSSRRSKSEFRLSIVVILDSTGEGDIFLPHINSSEDISNRATFKPVKSKEQNDDTKEKKRDRYDFFSQRRINSRSDESLMTTFASMESWKSLDGTYLELWPTVNAIVAECPGQLTLHLVANTPLSSKFIHIQSMIRGRLVHVTIPPVSVETKGSCVQRNDELGRYTCEADGNIKCLHGYSGHDCLQPICSSNCNPRGGFCSFPNECICNKGWAGINCDQCVRRKDCVHGTCLDGDDCVCDSGWNGYLCDLAEVVTEEIPSETTDNQHRQQSTMSPVTTVKTIDTTEISNDEIPVVTLHERNITLNLDSNWGPEATVVIFFYHERNIIPTSVQLKGMDNCIYEATSESSRSSRSLFHGGKHVYPGEKFEFVLQPEGIDGRDQQLGTLTSDGGQLSDQICFTKISDISLDNFNPGNTNMLNLKSYVTRLDTLKHYTFLDTANTVLSVFQAAGLQLTKTVVDESITVQKEPCMYMMNSVADARSMEGLPGPSPTAMRKGSDRIEMQTQSIPRLREFFPEIWIFDVDPVREIRSPMNESKVVFGVRKELTAPDTITSWRATAFCTTKSKGLWIAEPGKITVSMPFHLELTLPKEIKRGEILYLPVSVFVTRNGTSPVSCYEVNVETMVDGTEWLKTGTGEFTSCVCSDEKRTFQLGLISRKIGKLNVTAIAQMKEKSPMCPSSNEIVENEDLFFNSGRVSLGHVIATDMIRRPIRVVPEGIPSESAFGDILCLQDTEHIVESRTPISLPQRLVPGSLRMYWSYTDEVLGRALTNLDRLVSLPVGCGEQNMVLVAPNVYVLDYLKSVPPTNAAQAETLRQSARKNINTGYHNQLKYRRQDGSYSAFGDSDKTGSTWLTAFVLRVFARAYRVDPTISVDWHAMFNGTIEFLSKQQASNNCLIEPGRVIHAAMQGGLSESEKDVDRTVKLTSYVVASLWELKEATREKQINGLDTLLNAGVECLNQNVNGFKLQDLSTYDLAQLSRTFNMIMSESITTSTLLNELYNRRQKTADDKWLYWVANSTVDDQKKITATDIETTAYAYLALTNNDSSKIEKPFSILSWLADQQSPQGGFLSTQDTILGLEAIVHGAKMLGLDPKTDRTAPLHITHKLNSQGSLKTDILTSEKRGVLNQFDISVIKEDADMIALTTVSRDETTGISCVAVQTIAYFNIPSDFIVEEYFKLSVNINQSVNMLSPEACTTAEINVCVFLSDKEESQRRESGMLLAQAEMITGWEPDQEATMKSHHDDIRRVEFDNRGTTSFYFNGFTQKEATEAGGWPMLKRCARLILKQTVYVANSQSASIKVMDYYATEQKISQTYKLNECKKKWIPDSEPSQETPTTIAPFTTTVKPLLCPITELNRDQNDTFADDLFDTICKGYNTVYLIRVLEASRSGSFNVTVTTVGYSSNFASSWNSTIICSESSMCGCDTNFTPGSKLVIFSKEYLQMYAGQFEIKLPMSSYSTYLLKIKQFVPHLKSALEKWRVNQSQTDTVSERPLIDRWGCQRIPMLIRYIASKFL